MNARPGKKAYVAPALTAQGDVVPRTLGQVESGMEMGGFLPADAL